MSLTPALCSLSLPNFLPGSKELEFSPPKDRTGETGEKMIFDGPLLSD